MRSVRESARSSMRDQRHQMGHTELLPGKSRREERPRCRRQTMRVCSLIQDNTGEELIFPEPYVDKPTVERLCSAGVGAYGAGGTPALKNWSNAIVAASFQLAMIAFRVDMSLQETQFIRQKTNPCAIPPTGAINDQVVLQNSPCGPACVTFSRVPTRVLVTQISER